MNELSDFERAVLTALLRGEHPTRVALRAQAAVARVTSREMTGVGFFVNFEVPSTVPEIPEPNLAFGDVHAEIEGMHAGAGFVVFVTDGRLSMLEGFSYADPWPADVRGFRLSHP